jgi:hypothetical protein
MQGGSAVTESGELGFSRQDILVITACAISMLVVQMDWFALNLAIPSIAKHFNVASTDLQWVVSGYMLSIGALMVTAGRLADIFGRRLVIVIGLAIFGIVSLVCGTAPGELYLIIARVFQGIGAALIFPVAIAVVSSTFTGARQARAIGVVLGVQSIGQALGPFVGGTFSEFFSWRGVFFINIPFCVVAIYLMLRYVKETRDENADRHIDIPGTAYGHGRSRIHQPCVRSGRGVGMDVVGDVRHACRRRPPACAVRGDRGTGTLAAHLAVVVPQSRVRRHRDRGLAVQSGLLPGRGVLGVLPSAGTGHVALQFGTRVPRAVGRAPAERASTREDSRRNSPRIV